ncbi:hypothetical protein [Burkholderia cenocepacia]|uniref:hypothetical protein n=1 Tax=Burkholderia cenocepacia TaxID=95486 RepID=UPI00192BE332|nr:hypothetical protein [Burkholderia cenocepacia]
MKNKLSSALIAFGITLQGSSLFLFSSKAMAPVLLGGIVLTMLGLASFATHYLEHEDSHQAQPQEVEQEINGQAEFQFFKDK